MFLEPPASQILELEGVRVASGKFWSDIAGQRLCAFGGRLLVAATTVRTGLSVHSGVVAVAALNGARRPRHSQRSGSPCNSSASISTCHEPCTAHPCTWHASCRRASSPLWLCRLAGPARPREALL